MTTLYIYNRESSRKVGLITRVFLAMAIILSVVSFSGVAYAQNLSVAPESITSFASNIKVNTDNSIDVLETIGYWSGPTAHHGIYRDIRTLSSENRKMDIENISVADESGNPYQYVTSSTGDSVRVKIGDPNTTFTGGKVYVIKYHATRAVAQLKDTDEIYWNITGNEWGFPIVEARASVTLPAGSAMSQSACYYGSQGSTSRCQDATFNLTNKTYDFEWVSGLAQGEGLTVAVGFPKGVVAPYAEGDGVPTFWEKYLPWIILISIPLLTFIFSFIYWYKKGRDPKGTGVIVAQYDVPDSLSPMEVGGIVKQKVDTTQISAEIIYLATKGYIKITETENKILGLFKSTDYQLTKLKEWDSLNGHDNILMGSIFRARTDIKISDLKTTFYVEVKSIISAALDGLVSKGYYKNLGRMKPKIGIWALIPIVFIVIFVKSLSGFIMGVASFVSADTVLPVACSLVLSFIIHTIFFRLSPAKTEKGVATKEYLLGLKEYLQIAEKDRLQFHNAPEKNPEVFEALLPYAMVLGVTDIWAKEFKDITMSQPSWYVGPTGSQFNSVIFAHNIASFSTFTNNAVAPSGGGSGGGGFSGGGGGGGGGGSW
jgi:uncharacterized membrane protein